MPELTSKPSRQSFFGSLRKPRPVATHTPGMEPNLVGDLQNMTFKQQREAFQSAYSKFVVVRAETMLVSFYNAGIAEMLFASRGAAHMVGQDIFKLLGQYSNAGSIPREYKTRVKSAVKSGTAVSLDLSLCTRRTMGFERFLTHWTPLKDDKNQVVFVILTFGSAQDNK